MGQAAAMGVCSMNAIDVMQRIAFDWGVRCFGQKHMNNPAVRALRCAEEVVELAQCCRVPKDTLHKLIDTVYDRPLGQPHQEIGSVLLTTSVLCEQWGLSIENVFEA